MGSFCITCGASGQVIADDDPCLVIPIRQQSTFEPVDITFNGQAHSLYGVANSTCYPGAHWAPIGGFITGTYADYGRIAPEDTPTNRRAMVEFFVDLVRNAPVVAQGKNPCHDIPFDLKAFVTSKAPGLAERLSQAGQWERVDPVGLAFTELTAIWDYIWEVAQEHRLFYCSHGRQIRPLQFAAFHRASFNHLVRQGAALPDWGNASYELGAFLQRQLEELRTEVAQLSADKQDRQFFLRIRLVEQLTLNLSDSVRALLRPYMEDHLLLLEQHLDQGLPFEQYVEAMRPSMAGVYALKGMTHLDLKFSPIVYAGQDYDNSKGKAFAKFVTTVSKAISKQRKQRYDE